MNPIDRGDLGIVFYGSTASPLPTYTDVNGLTQTAVQISGSTLMPPEVDSAYFHVGGVSRFTLQVDVKAAPESEVNLDLGLVGHFDQDPTARFGELATFRNDNQQLLSVHTFESPGRYILQTANLGAIVEGAIQAQMGDGDGEVIVRLRVER
jgi:hypothetical protein